MVRAALMILAVWCTVATARAEERVVLPPCATEPTAPLDGELLRDLLELEVDARVARIEVGDGVCAASPITVRTVFASGAESGEVFPYPEEVDARVAARALALAIAERLRGPSEPASTGIASGPTGAGTALASPVFAPPEPLPEAVRAEPEIPVSVGVAAVGRLSGSITPQSLSWLLGLRGDLGARFGRFFGLRGELLALWSHGDASGFTAEASLFAVAATLVLTPLREAHWDVSLHVRGEFGALLFFGAFDVTQADPWAQLGGALAVTGEVSDGVALTVDLGAAWNALGAQFRSPRGDLLIDLSVLTLDLGAGVRFAI